VNSTLPTTARPAFKVHPTAVVEEGVTIGAGTAIWDNVHVRHDTSIGEECIVGGKTIIAYDVRIGSRVKINSFVYICTGVTLEDGVMVSAGTVFTNDRFPRAATPDLTALRPSDPDESTRTTLVREGATIGAHATIGCDLVIGRFAMVGMGSVVTRSVPDFFLVLGNPARAAGCVCRCGQLLLRFSGEIPTIAEPMACTACGLRYRVGHGEVVEAG
jgi:UDP-2-acetamido-3-amino-2,3-dideoxy-glucuronate N-acetyltransferase